MYTSGKIYKSQNQCNPLTQTKGGGDGLENLYQGHSKVVIKNTLHPECNASCALLLPERMLHVLPALCLHGSSILMEIMFYFNARLAEVKQL